MTRLEEETGIDIVAPVPHLARCFGTITHHPTLRS